MSQFKESAHSSTTLVLENTLPKNAFQLAPILTLTLTLTIALTLTLTLTLTLKHGSTTLDRKHV